jgi:hypothetical protein
MRRGRTGRQFQDRPGVRLHGARAAEKGTTADENADRIASRKWRAGELEQTLGAGEGQVDLLRKIVLELEEQGLDLRKRMAEAAERVKEEQRRLDVVIAELPIDQKIKIMAAL